MSSNLKKELKNLNKPNTLTGAPQGTQEPNGIGVPEETKEPIVQSEIRPDMSEEEMANILLRSTDKFYFHDYKRPKEMRYNWKRVSYFGKEDTQYSAECMRHGWKPVPAKRHPECGCGNGDNPIIVEGLMLMENFEKICQFSDDLTYKKALEQEHGQMDRLKLSENKHMPRKVQALNKNYARQEVPA